MLGLANVGLLIDSWTTFLICSGITVFLEWNRHKLHQALTHQHFVGIEKAKEAERERQAKILEEIKKRVINKA